MKVVYRLNGRLYPADNYLGEVFPHAWPTPERMEIEL